MSDGRFVLVIDGSPTPVDAAFLDLGTGKNGFIHVDEVVHEHVEHRRPRRLEPQHRLALRLDCSLHGATRPHHARGHATRPLIDLAYARYRGDEPAAAFYEEEAMSALEELKLSNPTERRPLVR